MMDHQVTPIENAHRRTVFQEESRVPSEDDRHAFFGLASPDAKAGIHRHAFTQARQLRAKLNGISPPQAPARVSPGRFRSSRSPSPARLRAGFSFEFTTPIPKTPRAFQMAP